MMMRVKLVISSSIAGRKDSAGKKNLAQDLTDALNRYNCASDGTLVAQADYAEVIIRKR